MAENIITITEEGYKKLTEELEYLRTTKRNEVRESVKVARSFGDLSENAEYDAARTEQAQVEAQIAELEDKLSRMKVVSETDSPPTPRVPLKIALKRSKVVPGASFSGIRTVTQTLRHWSGTRRILPLHGTSGSG